MKIWVNLRKIYENPRNPEKKRGKIRKTKKKTELKTNLEAELSKQFFSEGGKTFFKGLVSNLSTRVFRELQLQRQRTEEEEAMKPTNIYVFINDDGQGKMADLKLSTQSMSNNYFTKSQM